MVKIIDGSIEDSAISISGQVVQISGQFVSTDLSGVTITASVSGQPVLVSGQTITVASGQIVALVSGQSVTVASGQVVAFVSGQSIIAEGLSLGGFYPEAGRITPLWEADTIVKTTYDSMGNLNVRGATLTDEGSIRESFVSMYRVIPDAVATFTTSSDVVTIVGGSFIDGNTMWNDSIKLSTDPDSAWSPIDSVISESEVLLSSPYPGATTTSGIIHHARTYPSVNGNGSVTTAGGECIINGGTTVSGFAFIIRPIDYPPLIFNTRATVFVMDAGTDGYLGFVDSPFNPLEGATFHFTGMSDTCVNCLTAYRFGDDTATEYTQIQIADSITSEHTYRIEILSERVTFTIDEVPVAVHKRNIPNPYAYMNQVCGWANRGDPITSGSIFNLDYVFIANTNAVEVQDAFKGSPMPVVLEGTVSGSIAPTPVSVDSYGRMHTTIAGEDTGGFYPEAGKVTPAYVPNDIVLASFDAQGNLNVRGAVTTDEGSFREAFVGNTLYRTVSGAVVSFTTSSDTVTIVGADFCDGNFMWNDSVRLSTDPDTAWCYIDSVDSPEQITLGRPYPGATTTSGLIYHSKTQPVITGSGSVTITSSYDSFCVIDAKTTSSGITTIRRRVDFPPLIFNAQANIKQRVANTTGYVGFSDDPENPGEVAWFEFGGTSNTYVTCKTQWAFAGRSVPETTTVQIPGGYPTTSNHTYRIEITQENVAFTINSIPVAVHRINIPNPYAYMVAYAGWVNAPTPPVSGCIMNVGYVFVNNIDTVQVQDGFQGQPLPVVLLSGAIVQTSGQAVTAIDQTTFKTWQGKFFKCDDYINGMALNAVRDWVVLTSNQTVHLSYMFTTKADYYITIFETPTVTSNGIKLTATSMNRISSTTTVTSIYTSSNIAATGTQLEQLYLPQNIGWMPMVSEYVLKQNNKYLIRIKSLAASNVLNAIYYYYEGEV